MYKLMWVKGDGKGVKRIRVNGWGSWYQAGDQSGWEFATMSKKLALQVSQGLLFFCKGFDKDCLYIV
jgi:hypothetical protein